MIQHWKYKTMFYEKVERLNLHGLHVQYIELCERRAVPLDEERLESLWQALERLEQLAQQEEIPKVGKIALCETCALEKFCGCDV